MAGSTAQLEIYSIPYSGELKDGLVVLLNIKPVYDSYFTGAIYCNNRWNYMYCELSSISISSIELKNGKLYIEVHSSGDTYVSVFQTDNFPTE